MLYLEYFLYVRGAVIWNNRKMPSVRIRPSINYGQALMFLVPWTKCRPVSTLVHLGHSEFFHLILAFCDVGPYHLESWWERHNN